MMVRYRNHHHDDPGRRTVPWQERTGRKSSRSWQARESVNLQAWISGRDLELFPRLIRLRHLEGWIPEATAKEYLKYLFAKDYEEAREEIKRRRKIVEG